MIIKILNNNCELTDTKSIANSFNMYFANIGNQLGGTIPNFLKEPQEYLPTPLYAIVFMFIQLQL